MHQPIITLSPLEVESFPIDSIELNNIIVREKDKFKQALQKFEKRKKELIARNKGKVHTWPESEQILWQAEVSKIDAITQETYNYINRLITEVTQIPD